MDIGFIGLGNMGAPMAANLAASGHKITGFDLTSTVIAGIDMVTSAAIAAKGRDFVITMLPDGNILREVADEIMPVMIAGSCFIDCSTVDLESTMAVLTAANTANILCIDAPVSGGVGGAATGNLTFMLGGQDDTVAQAMPLFDIMGQRSIHCGGNGAGQAAKICNNMVLGVTMIASCEAIALADKLGLDRQKLFDVVSTSSGYNWSMNVYCPAPGVGPNSPADNGYKPGFSAALMLKDLCLATEASKTVGANTKAADLATKIYNNFANSPAGENADFSAILKTMTIP